jgi:hypothetical protein
MEDCIPLSECTKDFDFSLLFEHCEYTCKEIESTQCTKRDITERAIISERAVSRPFLFPLKGYIPSSTLVEIESLYIKQLIEKHFLSQKTISKNNVTEKDIKDCLTSNPNANINSTDNQGRTLMDVAVDLRNIGLIKYLKNKGLDLDQKDKYGFTIYRRTLGRGIMDSAMLDLLYLSKG